MAIRLEHSGLTATQALRAPVDVREPAGKPPAGLESAAREFESLFVQMMLKNMRAASLSDGIMDGESTSVYLEMFDKEVAREMASSQSLGIARMLVDQLGGSASVQPSRPSPQSNQPAPVAAPGSGAAPESRTGVDLSPPPIRAAAEGNPAGTGSHHVSADSGPSTPVKAASPVRSDLAVPGESAARGFASPDEFVTGLWHAAQEPARTLGVSPSTLIAQSALETGWGKHIPKRADGTSSHNLFGIKAGGSWDGDTVTKTTLEYVNGVAEPRREVFRAYDSLTESLTDYVRLVGRAPRYQDAMKVGTDPGSFFSELQEAGYATDPNYAKKAIALLRGQTMQAALHRLGAT